MNILILGAGPTGLGAAYHLHKLGHNDWQLFERNDHVGGLSASFLDDHSFTWDIGGHVLFSHYDYFDKAVAEALGDSYYEHQRESWVRILQTWVPNNTFKFPNQGGTWAIYEGIAGQFLESCDVYSRGRFSTWKYEAGNMDHSFMQGVEVVDRLLLGKAEQTVNGISR